MIPDDFLLREILCYERFFVFSPIRITLFFIILLEPMINLL